MSEKRINSLINIFVLITVVIFYFFQVYKGDNSIITIHDNLDSTHVYFKVLKDSGCIYQSCHLSSFLGVDRDTFMSEYSLVTQIYAHFDMINAYYLILALKVAISLAGVYLLLRTKYIALDHAPAILLGLVYSILPGFPSGYLSQAWIPLFLYVLVRYITTEFTNRQKVFCWIFFLITPSILLLFLHGVYVLASLYIVLIVLSFYDIEKAKKLFIVLFFITISYFFFEYRIFMLQIFSDYESIRSEFVRTPKELFSSLKINILQGHYHWETYPVYFYFAIFVSFIINFFKLKDYGEIKFYIAPIIFSLGYIFLVLIISSIAKTEWFYSATESFPLLNMVNWSRFILMYGVGLLFVLSFSLKNIDSVKSSFIVVCLLVFSLFTPSTYNDFLRNTLNSEYVKYSEFYGLNVFEQLKSDLGYTDELAIAVGFHPGILTFNNINTLDGYFTYAPLNYKHQFRKIIAPQLEVNESHRQYFDHWGGRMYVFEDSDNYRKTNTPFSCEPVELRVDKEALISLKVEYIFSVCRIINTSELGLAKIANVPWEPYNKLYIYSIAQ
ncbi:DUF6044 family protein [Vibrio diazotrophicus]|uniref:DUF6044 family protein n=2 Tax=Vibrio diazotrophicus TaxID=685 RepID=UPI0005A9F171|nr:DUF6044 family protein [Vibrio diazotrophicus]